MPSTSEVGHAKNVANFESLISFCTGYGTTYNPSKDSLKIANLQAQLTAAKTALADCKTKETVFDNATDARHDVFTPLKSLTTRVINALSISGVADSVIEGAKTINRKIQGQRASTPTAPASTTTPATNTSDNLPPSGESKGAIISSSQQSYDNLVEHFNGLIELVSSHTEYNPNEDDLKVTALRTYLTQLKTANTNVINTNTDWSNSRLNRDTVLYADKTGLVDTALDVKGYIKSLFGATSLQFGQVKGIEFKKQKV